MLGSAETAEMLNRLETDVCLQSAVVDAFFAALEAETARNPQAKGLSPAEVTEWARGRVLEVFRNTPLGPWIAQGADVPMGEFDVVARLRAARVYRYCMPDNGVEFFKEFLIEDDVWKSASDDMLRTWIEAHIPDYDGNICTAGKTGLAWVTDVAALPDPIPSLAALVNQLGLDFGGETLGLLCRYPRSAPEARGCPLRVPRSLDGLDYSPFKMQVDCGALHGLTAPADGSAGLPEAVHRGCEIEMGSLISLSLIA